MQHALPQPAHRRCSIKGTNRRRNLCESTGEMACETSAVRSAGKRLTTLKKWEEMLSNRWSQDADTQVNLWEPSLDRHCPHWYISLGKEKQDHAKPHTGRVKPIVLLLINIHSLILSVAHATDGHGELLMGQAPMVRFSTEDLVVRARTRTRPLLSQSLLLCVVQYNGTPVMTKIFQICIVLYGSHMWLKSIWNMAVATERLRFFKLYFISIHWYFHLNNHMWLMATMLDSAGLGRMCRKWPSGWGEEKEEQGERRSQRNRMQVLPQQPVTHNFLFPLNTSCAQLFHSYLLQHCNTPSQVEGKNEWQMVTNTEGCLLIKHLPEDWVHELGAQSSLVQTACCLTLFPSHTSLKGEWQGHFHIIWHKCCSTIKNKESKRTQTGFAPLHSDIFRLNNWGCHVLNFHVNSTFSKGQLVPTILMPGEPSRGLIVSTPSAELGRFSWQPAAWRNSTSVRGSFRACSSLQDA